MSEQVVSGGSIADAPAELRDFTKVQGALMVDAARIELATSALRTRPADTTQITEAPQVSETSTGDALNAETRINTQGSARSCTPPEHKNGHTNRPKPKAGMDG